MLSTSPFEFIVRHFFWLLLSVMIIGAINGLFFFPILLSLIGPGAEVIPLDNPNRISTPSPPPQRNRRCTSNNKTIYSTTSSNNKKSFTRNSSCSKPHHHHSTSKHQNNEPSLTTITEEPQSWQSSASSMSSIYDKHDNSPELQSIVVQPEVTVETHHHQSGEQNTKVTATANIKVELIAPGRARAYNISWELWLDFSRIVLKLKILRSFNCSF